MIVLNVEQGSPEWRAARLGIPTASRFDEILTPKTMKLSSSADKYRAELLAEWLTGEPADTQTFDFTTRGQEMEEEARDWYAMQRDVEVEQVGFILADSHRYGASPDGLIGTDGGLEMKCPAAHTHVGYLLGAAGVVSDKYRCQVQGNLWVAEREWWDVLSYHPTMPRALFRVQRDEAFIKELSRVVNQFCEYIEEGKLALAKRGIQPITDPAPGRPVTKEEA